MTFIEFLGFIISLVALIFLFFKRKIEESSRRKNPEEYDLKMKRKQEALDRLLKSVSLNIEKEEIDEEEFEEEHDDEFSSAYTSKTSAIPPPLSNNKMKVTGRMMNRSEAKASFKHSLDHYNNANGSDSHIANQSQTVSFDKDLEHRYLSEKFWHQSSDQLYEVERVKCESRAGDMIRKLPSRRELLIIKEVFDRPLALRNPWGNERE